MPAGEQKQSSILREHERSTSILHLTALLLRIGWFRRSGNPNILFIYQNDWPDFIIEWPSGKLIKQGLFMSMCFCERRKASERGTRGGEVKCRNTLI